jgi:hypothetical protein
MKQKSTNIMMRSLIINLPTLDLTYLYPTMSHSHKLFESTFIDMGVKAELVHCDFTRHKLKTVPFYLYPRSSISKTPLMLANHTGIIDSGYRGNLIGAFRALQLPDDNAVYCCKTHQITSTVPY